MADALNVEELKKKEQYCRFFEKEVMAINNRFLR